MRWTRQFATMLSVLCMVNLATACSTNNKEDEAAEPVPPTYLRVQNQAFLDMNIYVFRSSQRVKLGSANGNSVTRLLIPSSYLFGTTPLRFQADPIGGSRQSVSQEVAVTPGDEVTLVIPP